MLNFLKAKLEKLLKPDDIMLDGEVYMRRWRFGNPNGFGIRLHQILKSDPGRIHHDHPFDFVSVILRGGYIEHTPQGVGRYEAGSVLVRPAESLHRLELIEPTWTLVFRGPYRRQWGFAKWEHWQDYHARYHARRRTKAEEATDAAITIMGDIIRKRRETGGHP